MEIRFRNLADKTTEWVKVSAALVGDEFLVRERNIALLKPVTGMSCFWVGGTLFFENFELF